jgi:hypothetical protein
MRLNITVPDEATARALQRQLEGCETLADIGRAFLQFAAHLEQLGERPPAAAPSSARKGLPAPAAGDHPFRPGPGPSEDAGLLARVAALDGGEADWNDIGAALARDAKVRELAAARAGFGRDGEVADAGGFEFGDLSPHPTDAIRFPRDGEVPPRQGRPYSFGSDH